MYDKIILPNSGKDGDYIASMLLRSLYELNMNTFNNDSGCKKNNNCDVEGDEATEG